MNQFSSISQFMQHALECNTDRALPTNIVEKNDGFELFVKVPGVSKKDISVDIQGRIVKISVSKAPLQGPEQSAESTPAEQALTKPAAATNVVHLSEFSVPSKVERAFEFREALDADGASLDLKNGILTVSVAYLTRGNKRTLTLSE